MSMLIFTKVLRILEYKESFFAFVVPIQQDAGVGFAVKPFSISARSES